MLSGPIDQIERRLSREQLVSLLLRYAPRDDQDQIASLDVSRALHRRETPELAPELLLGLFAHAARVEHDHVRALDIFFVAPAVRAQELRHALGVVHVHLAAERVDVKRGGHGMARI